MLQTATAHVTDISSKEHLTCRILFDTGSQRTYVTDKVREKLKLKAIRKERIVISAFGQTDSIATEVDIVKIRVVGALQQVVEIEAICVRSFLRH